MDWDWVATFEQYYGIGNPSGEQPPVRQILDTAFDLLGTPDSGYQYNLAELAWLRRYLQDNPTAAPTLATYAGKLYFLGGGLTSPDNLITHGEAFIRNYLLGQAFLKRAGLSALLSNVCWIPDDFGQDPQLPVVLNAMGMTGVSFWRVPGDEPTPPTAYTPVGGGDSLYQQLLDNGVTFNWKAADGSTILTQQMSQGYGVIWDQLYANQNTGSQAEDLNDFINSSGQQFANLYFAPCGGDFSMPSLNLVTAVNDYNAQYYPNNGIYAVLGTFQDFIDAVHAVKDQQPYTIPLDSSNFWTGYFAGRIQLKINHKLAVNHLLAAETASTLLRAMSNFSSAYLDAIDAAITTAWETLIPSTHHDYVTGTSPDNIYWSEQLPISELALEESRRLLQKLVHNLGQSVKANSGNPGDVPYVVFNPSGFLRSATGNLVEIPMNPDLINVQSVNINGTIATVQKTHHNTLLFNCPGVNSFGYQTVYFSGNAATVPQVGSIPSVEQTENDVQLTISNGVVQITVSKENAWAIISLKQVSTGLELLQNGVLGNQIVLYNEPEGNLYQNGDELTPTGFSTDSKGLFVGVDTDNPIYLLENGPLRWHFQGTIQNKANNFEAIVEYILEINEPIVRMRVTGYVPSSVSGSVVTAWGMSQTFNNPDSGMYYGTPNHWNTNQYVPYWRGPTFRPTHDYCCLSADNGSGGSTPVGAIYHGGMPAWALDTKNNQLLGILFRNAPGTDRGAAGTDTAKHTQEYAYRIPDGAQMPNSCLPLQESLAFQMRQQCTPVVNNPSSIVSNVMADSGFLAAIQDTPGAMMRLARAQPGSGNTPTIVTGEGQGLPFSFVLRIYQPTNQVMGTCGITIPFLNNVSQAPDIAMVTALEEPIPDAAAPDYSYGVITIQNMPTLATLRVQSYSTYVAPSNGK
ncbi:MAG: hypothetical protein HUU01_10915 [Saprospiraceae bacterium]|nr:hypothetical protein [Saprospiraceae bacterium]